MKNARQLGFATALTSLTLTFSGCTEEGEGSPGGSGAGGEAAASATSGVSSSGGASGNGGSNPDSRAGGAGRGGSSATAGTGGAAGSGAAPAGGKGGSSGTNTEADPPDAGPPPPTDAGLSAYSVECRGETVACADPSVHCLGIFLNEGGTGYTCSNQCRTALDCSDAPSGAEAQAACIEFTYASRCVLVCYDQGAEFGCPTGMDCYRYPDFPIGYCLWM